MGSKSRPGTRIDERIVVDNIIAITPRSDVLLIGIIVVYDPSFAASRKYLSCQELNPIQFLTTVSTSHIFIGKYEILITILDRVI
jgi:hypothetical protein